MRVLLRTSRNEVPLQLPLFSPLGLPVGPQSVLHLLGDGAGFRLGPLPSGTGGTQFAGGGFLSYSHP